MTERKADYLGMAHETLHNLCNMLAARVTLHPQDSYYRATHALAWHAMDLTADAMIEQDRRNDPNETPQTPAAFPVYVSPDDAPPVALADLHPRYNLTSAQVAVRLGLEPTKSAGVLTLARLGLIDATAVLSSSSGRTGHTHRYARESVEQFAQSLDGER